MVRNQTEILDRRSIVEDASAESPLSTALARRGFLTGTAGVAAAGLLAPVATKEAAAAAAPVPAVDARHARGLEEIARIGGGLDEAVRQLGQVSPDFAQAFVDFAFGEVHARPGLEPKLREIAAMSALLTQGNAQPQLRQRIHGLLNAGGSPREVTELILHAMIFLGWSMVIDGVNAARKVFSERGITIEPASARADAADRFAVGLRNLTEVGGPAATAIVAPFIDVAPDLAGHLIGFAYGELWNRPGLDAKARHMAAVAILAAAGNRDRLLRFHVEAAVKAGCRREEILELMLEVAVHVGWPNAIAAVLTAQAVFADLDRPDRPQPPAPIAIPEPARESADSRYTRGAETMDKISRASGVAVVNSFNDIAPDLGRMLLEHAYGDVFSRSALDLRTRELAAVAALTALATATFRLPLKVHIIGALNTGATRPEIIETIISMSAYVGFPPVMEALATAGEVFRSRPT